MNFGDFTDGGNPGASDYIAGYRSGGGIGSDRRWLRSAFANPSSDDGLALGTSSLKWSDVFLANGAVINFNSSDITMTHSSNALTVAGGNFDAPITATSSTTARNLANRFGEIFNVKDYGAVGDGTTNDVTAINAAITAAAAAGGGVVLFPPSSTAYVIGGASDTSINLAAKVWLRGSGKFSTTLKAIESGTTTLISGVSIDNSFVTDLTIDAGSFLLTTSSAIAWTNCNNIGAERVNITNMGFVGVAINGCTKFKIADNTITLATASSSQNQGILVSSSFSATSNGQITRNTIVKTGIDISASQTVISKNHISSFKFGAGITTEQSADCHDLEIDGNIITGGSGQDVNGFWCAGIENWAKNSVISNNLIFSNDGDGIDAGGQNNTIIGNTVYNNGNGALNLNGIAARYGTATYNSNNSIYSGNVSFNTAGAGGPQTYGYSEQSSSLAGIKLVGNHFATNKTGTVQILSSTTTATTYGPSEYGGALTPVTSDGAALGTSSKMFSDLFLAAGGIVNFNNGNCRIVHATDTLAIDTGTDDNVLIGPWAGLAGFTGLGLNGSISSGAISGIVAGGSNFYLMSTASIFFRPSGATSNIIEAVSTSLQPAASDGAALGTGSFMWSDLFLASGAVINFNNGNTTITHSAGLLTIAGGGLKLLVGTNTIAPLTFQAGTNLSSAADGAMEFDGQSLFFSPDASDRRIIPTVAITRLHAAYTLADSTTLQKIFNASANGSLTLPVGSYIFECVVGIDAMSATGGNAALAIKAAGNATITNILQVVVGIDGAKATAGAASGASWSATDDAPAANTSVVTAGTATEMAIMWKGSFEITGAGTIIPSVDLITGGVTPAVKLGSYFMCWRMGAATDVTQGNWS